MEFSRYVYMRPSLWLSCFTHELLSADAIGWCRGATEPLPEATLVFLSSPARVLSSRRRLINVFVK